MPVLRASSLAALALAAFALAGCGAEDTASTVVVTQTATVSSPGTTETVTAAPPTDEGEGQPGDETIEVGEDTTATATDTPTTTEATATTETVEPAPLPAPVKGPYEAGGLFAIAKQLEQQLGYKPKVLQIVASDTFVQFQVQDRDKPRNVDQYDWRDGEFADPAPVRLSGSGKLADNLFPLFSVNLRAAPSLVAAGNALKIEGSETGTMIIRRELPFSDAVIWYVNVNGTRESKQLRAKANGKIYKVL